MVAAIPIRARVAKPKLTDVELYAWISQAEAGMRLEYHRGFLGIDVTPVISTLPEPERLQLADLGQAALSAFEQELVHLMQERVGPDQFAYIAVARPKPQAAAVSLSELLLAEQQPSHAVLALHSDQSQSLISGQVKRGDRVVLPPEPSRAASMIAIPGPVPKPRIASNDQSAKAHVETQDKGRAA